MHYKQYCKLVSRVLRLDFRRAKFYKHRSRSSVTLHALTHNTPSLLTLLTVSLTHSTHTSHTTLPFSVIAAPSQQIYISGKDLDFIVIAVGYYLLLDVG